METSNVIGPGTAGVAQRIPSKEEATELKLSILRVNALEVCSQNEY